MEEIAEAIAVQANSSGMPVQVLWRGRSYRVVGRPTPWIDRSPWWAWTAERLPQVVEQSMWTVNLAQPDGGEIIQAELSVVDGDWWRLERVRG